MNDVPQNFLRNRGKIFSPYRRAKAFALGALMFVSIVVNAQVSSTRTLKMLVMKNIPPLSYRDGNGELTGFNVDLGKALCEVMKVKCQFEEEVFSKTIGLISSGTFDVGMIAFIITPEREKQILFTKPYRVSKTFWISKIPITKSMNAKVAVVKGTMQDTWAKQVRNQYRWSLVEVAVNSELTEVLRSGRANAAISPASTALELMKEADLRAEGLSARVIEEEIFENPVAIGVNPNDRALCDQLNVALEVLIKNGQMDKINSKYYPFRIF